MIDILKKSLGSAKYLNIIFDRIQYNGIHRSHNMTYKYFSLKTSLIDKRYVDITCLNGKIFQDEKIILQCLKCKDIELKCKLPHSYSTQRNTINSTMI